MGPQRNQVPSRSGLDGEIEKIARTIERAIVILLETNVVALISVDEQVLCVVALHWEKAPWQTYLLRTTAAQVPDIWMPLSSKWQSGCCPTLL